MASKDYPKREEQANQQGQQALAAQPVVDSSQLLATLTQVFSTFQEHLQKQLQNQPSRPVSASAQAAANAFNDIVASLQLRFPPDPPHVAIRPESISPTGINLEWTDNTNNADGYKVWRCQDQGCENFVEISKQPANARAYSDVNLSSGTVYRYKVSAFNIRGETLSNIAEATTHRANA